MTTHYLCYPSHLDWLSAINRAEPVNALSIVETEWSSGLGHNTSRIVLSQTQGDTVHLLRLVTDRYQSHDGREPLDGKIELHEKRAESAWTILQTWLADQGLTVRRALLSLPKHLRLLDGHADGIMEFDKDLGWVFADRIDPAVLDAWGVPKPAAAALTASA